MDAPALGVEAELSRVAQELRKVEHQVEALEEELRVLGGKLGPLEARPLDDRTPDEKDEVKRLSKKEKQLRREKEQLRREKEQLQAKEEQLRAEKLMLLSGPPRVDVEETTQRIAQLGLEPCSLEISWGQPEAASGFALSASNVQSLDIVLCLSEAGFWQPPLGPSTQQVDDEEFRRVFSALCGCESYSQTCLEKVSETKGPRCVDALMIDRLRVVFSGSRFECTDVNNQQTMEQLGCGTGPTSGLSKPDFAVRNTADALVALVAEFKNSVTAPVEQLPQAAAVCCNVVLAQYAAGVVAEECRCDMVLSNGHLFQFAAVTLLPVCAAKLTVTSRVFDHSNDHDAVEISKRLAALVASCAATRKRGVARALPTSFLLDVQKHHEKPSTKWGLQDEARNFAQRCYVRIFDKLWSCEALRPAVVFPVGFLRNGGKLRSVLFEKLDETWSIGMPVQDALHESFLRQLRRVVRLVHTCNVVHMDLMPCNIAWRHVDGAVEIKLLDFDAATNLSFRIGNRVQNLALSVRRDFMWRSQMTPNVRFDCWYCFLYEKMPRDARAFAPVSEPSSPHVVNQPFVKWLATQNIDALRNEFDAAPLWSQELDCSKL